MKKITTPPIEVLLVKRGRIVVGEGERETAERVATALITVRRKAALLPEASTLAAYTRRLSGYEEARHAEVLMERLAAVEAAVLPRGLPARKRR